MSKSCSTVKKMLLKEIVCSELSDGAWFDKKSPEAPIQANFRLNFKTCNSFVRNAVKKNNFLRVILISFCGECGESWRIIYFHRVLGSGKNIF